jgi:hypothetical protein
VKKNIMQKWVKALRSGEYRQTAGALRRPHEDGGYGYCCLGVLCDLYRKEKKKGWTADLADPPPSAGFPENEVPSVKVCKWAGLSAKNPSVDFDDDEASLAALNDDRGFSFAQIANVIEENYKSL